MKESLTPTVPIAMPPSLGRIVHFVPEEGGEPRAAIVTKVISPTLVDLQVFGDGGRVHHQVYPRSVTFDSKGAPRTWCWPPRL